ncbi:MAG TPA: DUF4388 domain-containing protein [Thermoanaerobaculia bacterium]|nr:DUF4388 domain-containing protein [Thermoanaerobaculia bacterium]
MTQLVDAALTELQRYLDDEIQPNAAANAVAVLMAQPPELMMQRVGAWSAEQSRAYSLPPSDLLLKAMHKVYITGEMKLLDRDAVADYLDRVTTIALRICPVDERDTLRTSLNTMRMSGDLTLVPRSPVTPISQRLPTFAGNVPLVDDEARMAKRFSLIFDRLTREMAVGGGQSASQPEPQALAQLLTMAANRAQTGQQFNDYVNQIRPLTGGKDNNVFVILGGGMQSWDLPNILPGTPGAYKPPAQVAAMEKVIDLAEDNTMALKRLRELVTAAVQKFNEGSLAAAVWMLDVAEDTINERKLDITPVDQIRAEAAETINQAQLRKYADNKIKHAALKISLEFFPTLHIYKLFEQLRGEARAERRRALLGFLEAYGVYAREASIAQLELELERPDVDTYYLRNLIYLLHRIQRDSMDGVDRELEALAKASAIGQNIYVVKEASTALGQIRSEASVKLLTTRLAEFEALLLRNDTQYPVVEVHKLLDRIAIALGSIGTTAALLTLARHGMRANPLLGDTRARLASLFQYDLSFDDATVSALLKALRDEILGKLLGRLLPKKQDGTVRLIEALSGTRQAATEELFKEIAQRFPDQDVGKAAATVLDKWGSARAAAAAKVNEPVATLAGELEFFGLPSIMQSLAEMRATGMLTLSTKQKQAASKLVVLDGKFINAQTGQTRGADALYEVLEHPILGTFSFVPYPADRVKSDLEPLDMMGLLLEGMRRSDELQRMRALVPDPTTFSKTGMKPLPLAEEKDPALVRDVWMKAVSGTPVGEWERQLATDAYRVRRLVTHWLEQGALTAN